MRFFSDKIGYRDYQQSMKLAIDCSIKQNEEILFLHNIIRNKDEKIRELRSQISKLKGQDTNGKD